MKKILSIYKPVGLTPLQLIENLRKARKEYRDVKIGFAGRLDPLAHGVMLLMIADETKKREEYLGLTKEYEFEVLFGLSTDTYDAMGIIQNIATKVIPRNLEEQILSFISDKIGKQSQSFPPFSSKEVAGKPLYQWARENKLFEISIPEHEIEIYNFELLNTREAEVDEVIKGIFTNIKKVDGDFRQDEITKGWKELFKQRTNQKFTIAKLNISCSSGTYVRSLANELGQKVGCRAIALEILRIRVGDYTLRDSIKLL